MTPEEAFFTVHTDLPREGPGSPEDVLWALDVAGTPANVRILDAGCGPGADTVTLAQARPGADIWAVDLHEPFVEQTRQATATFGPRIHVDASDYLNVEGPFDLIWCAGAVYFTGVEDALGAWLADLAKGGKVAFSEPAWKTESPSDAARAFWAGEYEPKSLDTLSAGIRSAGWRLLGHRWVIGKAWKAYYAPLAARLEKLSENAPPALAEAIEENRREIANWEAARDEIAYALFVVEPA